MAGDKRQNQRGDANQHKVRAGPPQHETTEGEGQGCILTMSGSCASAVPSHAAPGCAKPDDHDDIIRTACTRTVDATPHGFRTSFRTWVTVKIAPRSCAPYIQPHVVADLPLPKTSSRAFDPLGMPSRGTTAPRPRVRC